MSEGVGGQEVRERTRSGDSEGSPHQRPRGSSEAKALLDDSEAPIHIHERHERETSFSRDPKARIAIQTSAWGLDGGRSLKVFCPSSPTDMGLPGPNQDVWLGTALGL